MSETAAAAEAATLIHASRCQRAEDLRPVCCRVQKLSGPVPGAGGSAAITVHADASAAKLSPVKEHQTPVKGAVPGHSRASSSGGCSSDGGDQAACDATCVEAVVDGGMRAAGPQEVPWDDRIGAIRFSTGSSPERRFTAAGSWPAGPVPACLAAPKSVHEAGLRDDAA